MQNKHKQSATHRDVNLFIPLPVLPGGNVALCSHGSKCTYSTYTLLINHYSSSQSPVSRLLSLLKAPVGYSLLNCSSFYLLITTFKHIFWESHQHFTSNASGNNVRNVKLWKHLPQSFLWTAPTMCRQKKKKFFKKRQTEEEKLTASLRKKKKRNQ